MKAIGVFPKAREVRIVDHPEPVLSGPDDVRLRILEVGVCGTDREICEFQFGEAPAGSDYLVLGHEALAEVVETGPAVTRVRRGDLVVPMVRLPCPRTSCPACRVGRQDFCATDEFLEHGIRRAHGFMTAQVVEREAYLVPLPRRLEAVGVLIEPLTIAEKALLQVEAVQRRLPWERPTPMGLGQSAVVLGAGPVGLLGAMALVARGYRTSVLARSPEDTPQAGLAKAIGAVYVSTGGLSTAQVAERIGPIDLVYEAAGAVQASFDLLAHLATNGVFVFTGVPGLHAPLTVDAERIMRNMVLQNQVAMGTVNAGRDAFETAVQDLGVFEQRWPGVLRGLVTGRYGIQDYRELLLKKPPGIKNVFSFR